MKPRLEILRNLLSEDGSIWISIYDDEGNYLSLWLISSCNMPTYDDTITRLDRIIDTFLNKIN